MGYCGNRVICYFLNIYFTDDVWEPGSLIFVGTLSKEAFPLIGPGGIFEGVQVEMKIQGLHLPKYSCSAPILPWPNTESLEQNEPKL